MRGVGGWHRPGPPLLRIEWQEDTGREAGGAPREAVASQNGWPHRLGLGVELGVGWWVGGCGAVRRPAWWAAQAPCQPAACSSSRRLQASPRHAMAISPPPVPSHPTRTGAPRLAPTHPTPPHTPHRRHHQPPTNQQTTPSRSLPPTARPPPPPKHTRTCTRMQATLAAPRRATGRT